MTMQGSKNGKQTIAGSSDDGSGNFSGGHREVNGPAAEATSEGPAHVPEDQRSCDSTEPDLSFSSSWDDSSNSSSDMQFRTTNGIRYQETLSDPDGDPTWSPLHKDERPARDVQTKGLLAGTSTRGVFETTVDKQSCNSTALDEESSRSSWHCSSESSNDMQYRTSNDVQYRMVESDPEVADSSLVRAAGPPSRAHNIMWLLICFLGIMASFVSYGIVLEHATSGGRKLHELSFIFISSIIGTLTAAPGSYIRHEIPSTIPSNRFIVLGAMSIGSTFCAIRALRYVIFPIQVLARSAKPVPVMLMGTLMGKSYPLLKYFYVVLIVLGVAIFIGGGDILKHDDSGADNVTSTISSSSQQYIGILLLMTALCFDGTTGAYEDKLMSVHRVEPFDLMLKFQLSKTLLSGLVLLLFNQLDELSNMVRGTGLIIILLGMCSAVGQVFIFVTIAKFGALTCSLMSLTRKATTLAASIIIYGHPINAIQIAGLCVGIGGMAMNTCNYGINGDTAGNSPHSYGVPQRMASRKRTLILSAVLAIFIAVMIASQLWQVGEYEPTRIPINENAEPCTYDQLYETFGSAPIISNEDECWKLSDRILRVSRSEILNFHNLIPLGHGNQSGVFKIFLELSSGEQCVAVYKTDLRNAGLCRDAWHHPIKNWGHTKSCISAYMRPRKTTMPAEFTGALVFLAQREANIDLPGLVPTWAIVPEILQLKNTRRFLRWGHSSERILGIIEPYLSMKRLIDVKTKVATSAINVERVMLPAAQGVAFINELGLAHQDILVNGFKNVGFIEESNKNESRAVVFDYGYMALDGKNDDCSLGRACNYCVEDFFPAPKMDDPIKHDLDNFRDIVIALLKMSPNRVEAERLEKTLQACTTMSELVAALKQVP